MEKIMLDLETLGVNPGCVILSVGAVRFDNSGILNEFHAHIDLESACSAGLVIEPSTVMWWLKQSEAARNNLTQSDREGLCDVLGRFSDWVGDAKVEIWANGASFDFAILKSTCEAVGMSVPWQFWNERCFRTLKNLVSKEIYAALSVQPTVAHDALADARAQALTTINLLNHLNGNPPLRNAA